MLKVSLTVIPGPDSQPSTRLGIRKGLLAEQSTVTPQRWEGRE